MATFFHNRGDAVPDDSGQNEVDWARAAAPEFVEIYFSDLCPEAQRRLLGAFGITDPAEMNWESDLVPLAILQHAKDAS